MNENPYASPQSDTTAVGVLSGKRADVRSVAQYQKGLLVCILVYLVAGLGQFAFPVELRLIPGLAVLAAIIAGAVFVFLLAIKVYGTGLGIVFGVLTLIPCVGLIVLLIVNQKATSILNQNGIKVGLIGADLSSI